MGFSQPVHISRLIPYDLCHLESPIDQDTSLRIRLKDGEIWREAEIISQQATGFVRLRYSSGCEDLVDLAAKEYEWIS